MARVESATAEWLEADGLGGFASGTVDVARSRRYHSLLLVATKPPAGRVLLVNGLEVWVETAAGRFAISSQRYAPDIVYPDGAKRCEAFCREPWPTWSFRLEDGTRLEQAIFVPRGLPAVAVTWRLLVPRDGVRLEARPLLSGRDPHTLHRENSDFRFDPELRGNARVWQPYENMPAILALSSGEYRHEPVWYRNVLYLDEHARGLDSVEDLASPGTWSWNLSEGEAVVAFASDGRGTEHFVERAPRELVEPWRVAERRRRADFASPLHRSAEAYVVRRGAGKSLIAGYPWFGDWGRDTFIAMRGLCLSTGRLQDARDILLQWSGAISEGMLPNRFPDQGDVPEYNSADASLWFAVAVHDYLRAVEAKSNPSVESDRELLRNAVDSILSGYCKGTRYGIRAADDGLLRAGEPGSQVTWMDARIGDRPVTPRVGKPVEVQALWLNALWFGSSFSDRWSALFALGRESFLNRFWNERGGFLYDVVDVDHRSGTFDAAFRPNQIFAVAGLPIPILTGERARRVVDAVETRLWTPLGLRTLAPGEPGYAPRYEGGVRERDAAYHQGTAWPWLLGAFVEGWVRVRGSTADAKSEARARFIEPLLQHLEVAGLGHVSELADGDAPHVPRGCPFQAWSLGELLRLQVEVTGRSDRDS